MPHPQPRVPPLVGVGLRARPSTARGTSGAGPLPGPGPPRGRAAGGPGRRRRRRRTVATSRRNASAPPMTASRTCPHWPRVGHSQAHSRNRAAHPTAHRSGGSRSTGQTQVTAQVSRRGVLGCRGSRRCRDRRRRPRTARVASRGSHAEAAGLAPAATRRWRPTRSCTSSVARPSAPTPSLVTEVRAKGTVGWLTEQLAPSTVSDTSMDAMLKAHFPRLGWTIRKAWSIPHSDASTTSPGT